MISLITITALALYATGPLQEPGMLLHPLRRWLNARRISSYISKPLYGCPPCMASVWGSLVWFFFGIDFLSIQWPLFVLATSGLTYLLIYNFPYHDDSIND